jgi:hypothetical protein
MFSSIVYGLAESLPKISDSRIRQFMVFFSGGDMLSVIYPPEAASCIEIV